MMREVSGDVMGMVLRWRSTLDVDMAAVSLRGSGKTNMCYEALGFPTIRKIMEYPENPVMDNDPKSPHRGTGRTTKQIEEAIRIAQSGTPVLYVCVGMLQAMKILSDVDVPGIKVASPRNDELMRTLCRGRTGVIIVDHACPDSYHEIARELTR